MPENSADCVGDFGSRDILALPAEGIADAVDEMEEAARVSAHEIAGAVPDVVRLENVAQDFPLRVLGAGVTLEFASGTLPIANSADRFADLVRFAADAKAVRVAQWRAGFRVELDERQREAMGEKGRNAADGADFAFDIVQRKIAFGRRVEFQYPRNCESGLELLPDVGTQSVAAADAEAMRALARMFRCVEQITGEFADILHQGAVPIADVVPELMRGEFLPDQHRAAAHQQRTGRHHAADAVIHRQAIIHAILRPGVHQAGEPEAPLQQPPVADIGGLGQAGGAGRVDQQRAVGDRHRAMLARRQRLGRESFDRNIDAFEIVAAVRPDFRAAREKRARRAEPGGKLGSDDDVLRRDDIDAMGERRRRAD